MSTLAVIATGTLACNTGPVQCDIQAGPQPGHVKLSGDLGDGITSINAPLHAAVPWPGVPGYLATGQNLTLNGRQALVFVGAYADGVEVIVKQTLPNGSVVTTCSTVIPWMGGEGTGFVKPTGDGAVFAFTP